MNLKATVYDRVQKRMLNKKAYDLLGNWAITDPLMRDGKDEDYVVVTHWPTGYRAQDVLRNGQYGATLRRFNRMFGNARTVNGVMRKYNALPKSDKNWIKKNFWA